MMNQTLMTSSPSDDEMLARIKEIRASATQRSGLVYELYNQQFHDAVEDEANRLDEMAAMRFLGIAEACSDYRRTGAHHIEADDDTCDHGLEYRYCPSGCGEEEDEEEDTESGQ
jgi:hypothetical protein